MSTPVFKKIEMVREAGGLSQPDICELLGISLNSYKGMIKRGSASFEIIEKVAREWPQYAYWLLTEKTNPPMHIAPRAEDVDKVLFDVIETIDQKDLLNGDSFVDIGKMNGVIFLIEDTTINCSMSIFVDVWIDGLKNSVSARYFAPPVIAIDPRFDFWYNDYPGSARDFRKWCDEAGITKFRLSFVKPGALSEINKCKLITNSHLQTELEDTKWAEKIINNFNLWKAGEL